MNHRFTRLRADLNRPLWWLSNPRVQNSGQNRIVGHSLTRPPGGHAIGRILLLLPCFLIFCGCVSSTRVTQPSADARSRIAGHVEFLAQPALRGRKPGTAGSRMARTYIEARFREYGLVPWGSSAGYINSFGYGKNVVGLLPGADPNFAGEIVLLSAHYDHLGRNQKGRICPGAADNASGVAALLEVARQLNSDPVKPKRSILFVCFDCEEMMLFGSFAFSCQKEVRDAKIVAVINVDMLGRDLLDVVRHTLFVTGAESYPGIRAQITGAGGQAGIRVLPLGTDLVGPRSDHVAFQSRGVPCLFFSCGTFRDYHQPEDTADKLDYGDIAHSSIVIGSTVRDLANCAAVEPAGPPESGFAFELRSVCTVLDEVRASRSKAGIQTGDAEAFSKLAAEAQELSSSNRYDRSARQQLLLDAGGILAPYFLPVDMLGTARNPEQREDLKLLLRYLQQFYLQYGAQIMEGYRQLVEQLLKYHPGFVRGMPLFHFELYDIPDDAICIRRAKENRVTLNALANCWSMSAQVKSSKWLLRRFNANIGSSLDPLDCDGTRQQVADFCLLRLREARKFPQRSMAIKKVFNAVTQTDSLDSYGELLASRLGQGPCRDETDWIVGCVYSGCDSLALEALDAVKGNRDERVAEAVCRVISDHHNRSDVRAAAMRLVPGLANARARFILCDLLNDRTPAYQPDFMPMTRLDYPFSDRIAVKEVLHLLQKNSKQTPSKTLGDLARKGLTKIAHKDLGPDPVRWRDWLRRHPVKSYQ